jgi:hypothetical protein
MPWGGSVGGEEHKGWTLGGISGVTMGVLIGTAEGEHQPTGAERYD